jgi:hypothetical protein
VADHLRCLAPGVVLTRTSPLAEVKRRPDHPTPVACKLEYSSYPASGCQPLDALYPICDVRRHPTKQLWSSRLRVLPQTPPTQYLQNDPPILLTSSRHPRVPTSAEAEPQTAGSMYFCPQEGGYLSGRFSKRGPVVHARDEGLNRPHPSPRSTAQIPLISSIMRSVPPNPGIGNPRFDGAHGPSR